ncbi:hypothetical protein QYM36_018823 [Artemia franciscana]|uniref:Protein kinase domain-containing protein n=1 Tax=Artemia franciscana TaxID=6661 RepID=A0AA88KUE9_ARTSF|nr:hypothetical protein QYM36_018823 [Artemia franciscana]
MFDTAGRLKIYNFQVDIWSLGITAIELSQREPPFFRQPEMEFIEHMSDVFLGGDYKLDYKFTMDFHNFIKRCLIGNPHRRPSAEELLNDPFIKGSSDKQYLKSLLIQNHDFRGEL